ncbi:MAG: hypothetical protein ACFFDF_20485 [Candidatus Odinarchaeota archaeon]
MDFEKGNKLNYKIKAILIKKLDKATLFNCEGDKEWFPNAHYDYNEKEKLLEIPEWLYNSKFK